MKTDVIYNEHCLNTIGRIKDKSIDLVVTSPPYNMNLRIRGQRYIKRKAETDRFSTKYREFSDDIPIDKFYTMHSEILGELIRVSDLIFYNIQIVTGSKRAFFKMIGDYSNSLKEIIVWNKGNPAPAIRAGVLNSQHELLLVFGDNPISRTFTKANFGRGELSNMWDDIPREASKTKSHGAIFPTAFAKRIIENFSNEEDIVYDPFMGTGTTAVACVETNRRYIGSEISKHYCDIAGERLSTLLT